MFLLYLPCSHQYLWVKLDKTENTFIFQAASVSHSCYLRGHNLLVLFLCFWKYVSEVRVPMLHSGFMQYYSKIGYLRFAAFSAQQEVMCCILLLHFRDIQVCLLMRSAQPTTSHCALYLHFPAVYEWLQGKSNSGCAQLQSLLLFVLLNATNSWQSSVQNNTWDSRNRYKYSLLSACVFH